MTFNPTTIYVVHVKDADHYYDQYDVTPNSFTREYVYGNAMQDYLQALCKVLGTDFDTSLSQGHIAVENAGIDWEIIWKPIDEIPLDDVPRTVDVITSADPDEEVLFDYWFCDHTYAPCLPFEMLYGFITVKVKT